MANMKTNFLTKTAWYQHIVGTSEEEGCGHPLDTFKVRYLEMRGQGSTLKMGMPVFPSPTLAKLTSSVMWWEQDLP